MLYVVNIESVKGADGFSLKCEGGRFHCVNCEGWGQVSVFEYEGGCRCQCVKRGSLNTQQV